MLVSKVTITIDTSNETFVNSLNDGIESVLVRCIETQLKDRSDMQPKEARGLYDSNGNRVGEIVAE